MGDSADPNISAFANASGVRCSIFGGNQHYCDTIVVVRRVMASLSMIGCLFMILVIWVYRKYAVFAQRLILYLSISALISSIAMISTESTMEKNGLCIAQAWAITMFDWSTLLWVCCITFNLYMNAVKLVLTDKFEWAYHLVSWGLPFLISCLPFAQSKYGPASMWCWIEDDWRWRFGTWYAPLFLIIFGLLVVYVYIGVMINRQIKTWEGHYNPDMEQQKKLMEEDVKPLKFYPLIYLCLSVFPLINRIQNALNPHNQVFGLVLLHTLTWPFQGAINAVVFGMDKETRGRLRPSQFKLAIQAWRTRSQSLIREYPTDAVTPNEHAA